MEYKRKVASVAVAKRLLEITLYGGRNEALRATSGMALAHILHLVVTTNSFVSTTEGGENLEDTVVINPKVTTTNGIATSHLNHTPNAVTTRRSQISHAANGVSPLTRLNGNARANNRSSAIVNTSPSPTKMIMTNNGNMLSSPKSKSQEKSNKMITNEGGKYAWANFITQVLEGTEEKVPSNSNPLFSSQRDGNGPATDSPERKNENNTNLIYPVVMAMVECLQDGSPKLQQACLNILNIVFAGSSIRNVDVIDDDKWNNNFNSNPSHIHLHSHSPHSPSKHSNHPSTPNIVSSGKKISSPTKPSEPEPDSDSSLNPGNHLLFNLRQAFLLSSHLITALLRLADQGSSSVIKAKALLALQLLCRHSPHLLVALGDRRFPLSLVRLVEPYLTKLEEVEEDKNRENCMMSSKRMSPNSTKSKGKGGQEDSVVVEPTYVEKAGLSMILLLREAAVAAAVQIYLQQCLATKNKSSLLSISEILPGFQVYYSENNKVLQRNQMVRNLTDDFVNLHSKHNFIPFDDDDNNMLQVNLVDLEVAADILRATLSMAAQPSLRRLMVFMSFNSSNTVVGTGVVREQESSRRKEMNHCNENGEVVFVRLLAMVLGLLSHTRACVVTQESTTSLRVITNVEQAAMVALEIIGQVIIDLVIAVI